MIRVPTLVLVAVIHILGIIIAKQLPNSLSLAIWFPLIFLFFVIIFCLKRHPCPPQLQLRGKLCYFIVLTTLLLFSVFYSKNYFRIAPVGIEKFNGRNVVLTGVVVSEPKVKKWQTDFLVKVETIGLPGEEVTEPGKCKVLIRLRTARRDIFYGEKYKFFGVLRIADDTKFKSYLQRQKISAIVNVGGRRKISYIGEENGNLLIKTALRIKRSLFRDINDYISPVYSPLLGGMMFKAGIIPAQVRDMFQKIGVVHILAISGLHVGIMCGIFLLICRLLNIPKRIACVITFVLIILYALVTGLETPVVRAGLMIDLFLLGYIIRRKTDVFITLSAASLLILLWKPYELFDVGFQLSFITVLGIVISVPRFENLLRLNPVWFTNPIKNLSLILVKLFIVSVSAWLASLPLVAYHFGYISWVGPLSNLIVIPLVAMVLAFGFILLISIWILPFLSNFLGVVINFLLFLLLKISEIISSGPFVYSKMPEFNPGIVFIYYFLLAVFLFYPKLKEFKHAR